MAVDVVGFEMVHSPLENGAQGDSSSLHKMESENLDNGVKGKESSVSDLHRDKSPKVEGDEVSVDIPKDTAEQIHSFYFVKHRTYDDPTIKAKLAQADKEIRKRNLARFRIMDELKAKRTSRTELISQLKSVENEERHVRAIMSEKTKEMKPLQQALGRFHDVSSRTGGICASEEELDELIQSLNFRIQHESISLPEEKQLLKEIKQLEGTREKVIANAAMRAKVEVSLDQKKAIQDLAKFMGDNLEVVRKMHQAVVDNLQQFDDEVQAIDGEIKASHEELTVVTQKRDEVFERIKELRSQMAKRNSIFYECRRVIGLAQKLASNKDIKTLEELCNMEVEKFMSEWNSSKGFRDDYIRKVLPSHDDRQLSNDGRTRNPDEKANLGAEVPVPFESEAVAKTDSKRVKEDLKFPTQQDSISMRTKKTHNVANNKVNAVQTNWDCNDVLDEEIFEPEKPKGNLSSNEEVDPEKLKELKREEALAKARQAMERKKKLAEKAALRAALRAQKEVEKKREKKAKKKAVAETSTEEPDEVIRGAHGQTKGKANVGGSIPVQEKPKKENTIKYRHRAKAPDSIPKAILKRRKSSHFWLWCAVAAVLFMFVMLMLFGWHHAIATNW